MYFKKYHHPCNFVAPTRVGRDGALRFPRRKPVATAITAYGDGVFRFVAKGPGWERNHSLAGLTPTRAAGDGSSLALEDGALVLRDAAGAALLTGMPGKPLAVSGESWLMEFAPEEGLRYFGLGEKHLGWEKKKVRTKYWNTDAWGDFHMAAIREASYDPAYVAIPYLVVKRGDTWFGILMDCPETPLIALPNHDEGKASPWFAASRPTFYVGADSGQPSVWFLVGPTLAALTRKLQMLCGPTPLPPLWALGHQQCRWGYESPEHLHEVAKLFRKHKVPNDGVWLDIEYMEKFKVFTWDEKLWAGRDRVKKELKALADQGHPVVPILDPGVKVEAGYGVYEDGLKAGIFCKTREGIPYTGFVWPGETAFPDFSQPAGRAWWAERVAQWAGEGVGGAWLDMNDPSVGSAELGDMRFADGGLAHPTFHNQYGLGMAIASREGFLKAAPDKRPFLLCRSGWIGTSRHTAVWTGDNCSNWIHLKGSIALSMALAISGVPFNGPDVPGFGTDVDRGLAVAWYKAGFLFPFFRNHSAKGTNYREPWRFGPVALRQIGHVIRLRYQLLPYLYNLWIDQEQRGEAVMRPLCYDHADGEGQDLAAVGDQFLCGPALLHAPVLDEGADRRQVVLPPGKWFDLDRGKWLTGGRTIPARQTADGTPLFVRDGSLLALQPGVRTRNTNDLSTIELHAVLRPGGSATTTYAWDDGASFAYRQGARSAVTFTANLRGTVLTIDGEVVANGAGPLRVAFAVHAPCTKVVLRIGGKERELATSAGRWRPLGSTLRTRVTGKVTIG